MAVLGFNHQKNKKGRPPHRNPWRLSWRTLMVVKRSPASKVPIGSRSDLGVEQGSPVELVSWTPSGNWE